VVAEKATFLIKCLNIEKRARGESGSAAASGTGASGFSWDAPRSREASGDEAAAC